MSESKKLKLDQRSERKPRRLAADRKEAFDATMAAYRSAQSTGIGAAGIAGGGAATKNPAKPNLSEFKADVEKIVESVVLDYASLLYFYSAYIRYDSEDAIEREMFADRLLGEGRHAIEQRLGALFISRGLYSTQKYFTAIRKPRAK